MLIAENIVRRFDSLEVLKGVSLEIGDSEIVSIVGSSGAGKTTLLQILGTLDRQDGGKVLINGIDTAALGQNELAKFRNTQLGFIFQFHQLLPEFTAIENAVLPALIKGESMAQAKTRAKELFDVLHISHRLEHKPSELSGGEQQRVAVARALMNRPAIVFADEPSGNLDSKNSGELHDLFFELREKFRQSFVIVTHNESLANMADRKLTMNDGRLI
ncbi:MAG: lipoprotein transporter ATP-binding protein [Crocinitomicaceae bacterium]|jgi:lipoprotein-releasing system ATP-binding protein|nr:lipoprotein transporter ATP-binding protein [Crocinitomicaceae bacterium]